MYSRNQHNILNQVYLKLFLKSNRPQLIKNVTVKENKHHGSRGSCSRFKETKDINKCKDILCLKNKSQHRLGSSLSSNHIPCKVKRSFTASHLLYFCKACLIQTDYTCSRFLFQGLLSAKSCPTLCNPKGYTLPSSSVHGIYQARILKWVAIPFSRGFSQARDQTWVSSIAGRFFSV